MTDDGWRKGEREQIRARLSLTHAERLRWLEQAKRFARSALGAARRAKPVRS
jgi:predicted flap endonuclease-1-like 5' DNA nuclease